MKISYKERWGHERTKKANKTVNEKKRKLEKKLRFEKLQEKDKHKVKNIRQRCGRDFPDIPILFGKISDFFSTVNNHFLSLIIKKFE